MTTGSEKIVINLILTKIEAHGCFRISTQKNAWIYVASASIFFPLQRTRDYALRQGSSSIFND